MELRVFQPANSAGRGPARRQWGNTGSDASALKDTGHCLLALTLQELLLIMYGILITLPTSTEYIVNRDISYLSTADETIQTYQR